MNNIALLTAWNLQKEEDCYWIANTHYCYLEFISKKYDQVYLISTVNEKISVNKEFNNLNTLPNVKVMALPYVSSYISSQKKVLAFYKIIKQVSAEVDLFYTRVPDPFCWMPSLLFGKKTIMHFVGDAIDATKYNEKWSSIKKKIIIAGYWPNYWLTLKAAKKSKVYTNGGHLAERLKKYKIDATPVISSTIRRDSLTLPLPDLLSHTGKLRLIYIGYIRYAKGMHCLMNLWEELHRQHIDFHFDMVGNGEMFADIETFINKNSLQSYVTLHGHIDNRLKLNEMLRKSDLFIFPSLSEGSPRVVIEAMAQGIPVVSTPVGSLPHSFAEKEDIRFFDYNDVDGIVSVINEYLENKKPFLRQRDNALEKVKENYTIESFLSKVFSY